MGKTIRICTDHSTKHTEKTEKIDIEMMGGSPWFAYLWIDDVCYTIRKKDTGRTFQVVKTK